MSLRSVLSMFRRLSINVALSAWVTSPVWADDTEIFFGDLRGGGAAPNVVFILDTSGSMGGFDGTDQTRMQRLKVAMNEIIGDLNDVNVGLMRFSNPGGPVLYPVSYIDGKTSQPGGTVTVVSQVEASADDAIEDIGSGVVTTDGIELRMGGVAGGDGGSEILISKVNQPDEDGIEFTNGAVRLSAENNNGSPRDLYVFRSTYRNFGLRFNGLDIPPGSTILSASLDMTVRKARGFVNARVRGDRPPAWGMEEDNNDISDRGTVPTSIDWTMSTADGSVPADGERITSPDLKDLVQEIIDDNDWQGDEGSVDDVVLIIDCPGERCTTQTNSGRDPFRRFATVERSENQAAQLTIRYASGPPDIEPHAAGLILSGVDVPQNVTVTSARLVFDPLVASNQDATLTVSIEDSISPAAYTGSLRDITSRSYGPGITWNADGNDWTAGGEGEVDVTSLINDHVDRADWCGGGDIAFKIEGNAASRIAHSFDSLTGSAPRLEVTYDRSTLTPGDSCRAITASKRVIADTDDGFSSGAGASVATAGNAITLESGKFGLFRFTDLPIPRTADIRSAYLELVASSESNTTPASLRLSIEDVNNADGLSSGGAISSRNFTGGTTWSAGQWIEGSSYASPDIKGLISSAISGGWVEGNDILLRVDHSSGSSRSAFAHEEANQLKSAKLIINYVDDGSQGADTVREELLQAVNSLTTAGWTPVQDTMYEAYQYYTGSNVVWGKYRGGHNAQGVELTTGTSTSGPFTYTRVSAPGSITTESFQGSRLPPGCPSTTSSDGECNDSNGSGQPKGEYLLGNPVYKSPIDNYCQTESHLILLTDGEANSPNSEAMIKSISGLSSCSSGSNDSERCIADLAELMQDTDISPLEGSQRVTTHTIGFNFSSQFLEDVAASGGGLYKEASSSAELVEEIEEIFAGVLDTDTSFVAPVAAINQFNRLTNLDDVYFAVFRPDSVPAWRGNLKKYKLGEAGGERNVLLDANNNPAVSETTGFFLGTSKSFWSTNEDGSKVDEGGAGEQTPSASSRNVYTSLGLSNSLTDATNLVVTGNASLTAADLDVPAGDRDSQISWIRGVDVDDEDGDGDSNENRYTIADPLHSKPVAVTYSESEDANTGEITSDVSIFMATNEGRLHAINAATGEEIFSYIPKELLPLQTVLRANNSGRQHAYGLDGSVVAWTNDSGSDGITEGGGDFVRIYAGMRRGGRNIYALDATNRSSPKFMWQINGGSTTGFGELGETWSAPVKGRITLAGNSGESVRDVLFFGGGYDPAKDSYLVKEEDTIGRAFYIVDAVTGELIFSAGPTGSGATKEFAEMKYSIPAQLSVVDADSDGIDDIIFVGDTGGQVWRFDVARNTTAAAMVQGGVIADVSTDGDTNVANNRMFFHSPDVALIERDGKRTLAISIGSGKRPNPLGTSITDRFYVLFEGAVFGPPASYVKRIESDLFDTTENLIQQGTAAESATAAAALDAAGGYYFNLPRAGEKVLSTPLTFRDTITFTTYSPSAVADSCIPKAGTSFVYQVNILDGSPVNPTWDTVDGFDKADRAFALDTPAIIDEPVIICTGAGCDLFTGAEKPPIQTLSSGSIIKSFWREDR
ncbi:hypothetical protein A3709_20110 [Halioglobus sp. HI00S01]|uniref:PilC/PilY family type IV pilus protein n=1 Tax=Halioglobus sp. HI00S01 TaxID=1822214 RepID=UPI0007C20700|nr:PilC/PilY family type IV pilus protein [Halioglobus sp. HI00S01]KZX57931.1 hypothetical protein A3709_20110 [Halioglobus sp. HI00S01]